jgi:acyl dehydratase
MDKLRSPDSTPFFEDVEIGEEIPPLVKRPTSVQLFRFSAVTWNPHRIHYDKPYAESEEYPDILVQSHLHGCFLSETVMRWAGPNARLIRFGWQNRRFAVPGDVLTCSGQVKKTYVSEGAGLVECELEERNQDGELCAPGWATVELPRRHTEAS